MYEYGVCNGNKHWHVFPNYIIISDGFTLHLGLRFINSLQWYRQNYAKITISCTAKKSIILFCSDLTELCLFKKITILYSARTAFELPLICNQSLPVHIFIGGCFPVHGFNATDWNRLDYYLLRAWSTII